MRLQSHWKGGKIIPKRTIISTFFNWISVIYTFRARKTHGICPKKSPQNGDFFILYPYFAKRSVIVRLKYFSKNLEGERQGGNFAVETKQEYWPCSRYKKRTTHFPFYAFRQYLLPWVPLPPTGLFLFLAHQGLAATQTITLWRRKTTAKCIRTTREWQSQTFKRKCERGHGLVNVPLSLPKAVSEWCSRKSRYAQAHAHRVAKPLPRMTNEKAVFCG